MARISGLWLASMVALGSVMFIAPGRGEAAGADGTYRGLSQVTLGPSFEYGKDFRGSVTIANGQFDYMWDRKDNAALIVSVAPDGTLIGERSFGSRGMVVASGRVANGVLEADLTGKICHRHLSFRRG